MWLLYFKTISVIRYLGSESVKQCFGWHIPIILWLEAGGWGVQGHTWLYSELRSTWATKSHFKNKPAKNTEHGKNKANKNERTTQKGVVLLWENSDSNYLVKCTLWQTKPKCMEGMGLVSPKSPALQPTCLVVSSLLLSVVRLHLLRICLFSVMPLKTCHPIIPHPQLPMGGCACWGTQLQYQLWEAQTGG